MMTGCENYNRAIEFKEPEYLPSTAGVDLGWLHEKDPAKVEQIHELQSLFPHDMLNGLNVARNAAEPQVQDGVARWVDEWGTGWENDGHGAKTESYPLLKGYEREYRRVMGNHYSRALRKRKLLDSLGNNKELEEKLPRAWVTFKEYWRT